MIAHVACLLIVFCLRRLAMPPLEHDDERHATLLSAPRVVGFWKMNGAGRKKTEVADGKQ